jgi:two-component system, chemotaxis family, response regulator PixH
LARRILLADDSVTAQNMGRRILTDAGYDVITVNNGSAALKKITENKPDLIVLDVYMPGYGGLEVCQRVKENPETTRIPVLLTVGKLEPFKPEEARRVGADAFIVKPFEATELLTALTKLEDKIVAAPQPQKSGRFAKALAAVEQSDKGASFGDKETGWKNRLTIPSPNSKPRPGEAEPGEVPGPMSRELDRGEGFKPADPKQEFERPIPAGLPADITPEEIAAIAAAAASIGGQPQQTAAPLEPPPVEAVAIQEVASSEIAPVSPSVTETPAATLPSAPEPEKEICAEAPVEIPAEVPAIPAEAVSEAAVSEPAKAEEQPSAPEPPAVAAQADPETRIAAETESPAAEKPAGNGNDAEVMAAIAWLAPANGHGIENIQPAQTSARTGQEFSASAYQPGITAALQATGPRWIAEAVTVASDEAMLVLEHEMAQSRAASVVVEAAPAHLPPAVAIVSEAPRSEVSSSEVPSQPPVAEPTETAQPAVAAVATVEAPAAPAEPESVPTSVAAESASVESPAVEIAQPAMVTSESAYAAAASAGSAAERAQPAEELSSAATAPGYSQNNSTAHPESTQREAELAAAWQNWRHIRESFVSPQPSSEPTSEPSLEPGSEPSAQPASAPEENTTVAEVSSQSEEAAAPATLENAEVAAEVAAETEQVDSDATDAPGESTAIASIVDTMLAELRPKLVEEIAKKMSSEKKEKDKKKKK